MEPVSKAVYLEELKNKLEHYYFATRGGATAEDMLAGLMGYVEAGLDLGAVTRAEQQMVIERAYERVFGGSCEHTGPFFHRSE